MKLLSQKDRISGGYKRAEVASCSATPPCPRGFGNWQLAGLGPKSGLQKGGEPGHVFLEPSLCSLSKPGSNRARLLPKRSLLARVGAGRGSGAPQPLPLRPHTWVLSLANAAASPEAWRGREVVEEKALAGCCKQGGDPAASHLRAASTQLRVKRNQNQQTASPAPSPHRHPHPGTWRK